MQITKCLSMFTNQTYYFSTCILGFVELFYYEIMKKNNFETFIVFLSHLDINNYMYQPYERIMRKPTICIGKKKDADQLLNPKFPASSCLLCLYSPEVMSQQNMCIQNLVELRPCITLEPEILYLAYLALEVTSPAIVGLNAFLASPNLP